MRLLDRYLWPFTLFLNQMGWRFSRLCSTGFGKNIHSSTEIFKDFICSSEISVSIQFHGKLNFYNEIHNQFGRSTCLLLRFSINIYMFVYGFDRTTKRIPFQLDSRVRLVHVRMWSDRTFLPIGFCWARALSRVWSTHLSFVCHSLVPDASFLVSVVVMVDQWALLFCSCPYLCAYSALSSSQLLRPRLGGLISTPGIPPLA